MRKIYYADVSNNKSIKNPRRIICYDVALMKAINPNNSNWYDVRSVLYDHIRGKDWYLEEITEEQARVIAEAWGASLYV